GGFGVLAGFAGFSGFGAAAFGSALALAGAFFGSGAGLGAFAAVFAFGSALAGAFAFSGFLAAALGGGGAAFAGALAAVLGALGGALAAFTGFGGAFFEAADSRRGAGAFLVAAAALAGALAAGFDRAVFLLGNALLRLRSGLALSWSTCARCGALGHLLAGLGLVWIVPCFPLVDPGLVEKPSDPVGRQRAFFHPLLDPLEFQGHPVGVIGFQYRVVGPDFLDETPVARASAVGHHDRVERALFGAPSGQSDFQGHSAASPLNS